MAKSNNYNGLNPKLLEYNPKYFSKNGFIQMIERSYKDGEFKAGKCSFHIYCTVYDSLVIIRENTIECDNDHLKKCITKTAKMHFNSVRKNEKKGGSVSLLSSNEIEEIYYNNHVKYSKGLNHYSYDYSDEGRKRIAKQVWNMVRNDGTPDEKKFLTEINYGDRIQAKDMPVHYQNYPILYDHYSSQSWAEKKRGND
ncbi:hypothetical protein C1645_876944 [Glomus cerebriforme]|uniref:Uncharacterized protein n=1 Tax=Glomus cerebriforme TaxID=658196 RepID=A0A397SYN4_9GLOM|nr:hypothetical protein C1645_876944 [Glomus cerebriforme]